MILLVAETESLEAVTAQPGNVDYTAAWADITTTSFAPGAGQGNTTAAGTVTLVAAPGASTQRQVKLLTLRAILPQTVYVQKNVGGTLYRLTPDVALAAGEVLQYVDGMGFSVLDPFARPKAAGSVEVSNAPTGYVPWETADGNAAYRLDLILAEIRTTNLLLAAAFGISIGRIT